MQLFYLLVFLLLCQCPSVQSHCLSVSICECPANISQIICDGHFSNASANFEFPSLSSLPAVEAYIFRNFKEIRSHAFENVTFLRNHSIRIHLANVNIIRARAFSERTRLPNDSTLTIDIDQHGVILEKNAFQHIRIHQLRFLNIQRFNNGSLFDSRCFGQDLRINELVFNETGLSGFIDTSEETVEVRALVIRHCPLFNQLNSKTFPSYLRTARTLEIADTGLESIDSRSFQGWRLVIEALLLKDNKKLTSFPSHMIEGVLMLLETLDLSNNPIRAIDSNYDWFAYSPARTLRLRQQQLDVFLKGNILAGLGQLKKIDFSDSFIVNDNHTNDRIIRDYFPALPYLTMLDISRTNLTEEMLLDLLGSVSRTVNQVVEARLLGYRLNNDSFCSYFNIFRRAPNLLQLGLDAAHECNCVVDLFYRDEGIQNSDTYSEMIPTCLYDTNRVPCDIQRAVNEFQCPLGRPNPDDSGSNIGLLGNYAFIGLMVGIGVVLLILLGVGSGVLYRSRQRRRLTDVDMEDPVERSTSSTSIVVEQPPTEEAA